MVVTFIQFLIIGAILYALTRYMKPNLYTLQKIGLGLGILIVLNLLFNYGITLLYPSPDFNTFCSQETRRAYETQDSCEAVGGEWLSRDVYYRGDPDILLKPAPSFEGSIVQVEEYCNAQAACRGQYDDARSLHNRNVFIVLIVLGTIAVGLGFLLVEVSAISVGFLYGGLLSYFIATVRFWSDMNEYLRVIELVVVLGVLVAFGYKKLKDKK